ncbi:outer membrane beta-barrel protein [Saccharicrinis aurantiacus]|uniref:outer membrane beta-barrel protein n=1 Tax=Saccharicrinis aurantiacus TaxID=1849719 RepID=UPI00094FF750|nr:outer membrane beta-barrel protein [Saccharicrinis aurantiacus]
MFSHFKYLIIGVLCFVTHTSIAQQHFEGINWGFKLGLLNNNFDSDVGPWTDPVALKETGNSNPFQKVGNIGIQLGGFIGYDFNDYLALQADLQYTHKGEEYTRASNQVYKVYSNGGSSSEEEFIRYQLRYIELPLAIRITPIRRFSIKLGISPGFNIYSKIKYNSWIEDSNNKLLNEYPFNQMEIDAVKQETDKVDFDYASPVIISGLAELNYNMKRGFLFISYNASFTDIFSVNKLNGYNYQTTDAYVSFGYGIRFIEY